MSGSIIEATLGELALVTGAIPELREEWVPGGYGGLMKYMRSTSAVAELREVRAIPRVRVELVLFRIEVVWRTLSIQLYQWYRPPSPSPSAYLVVAYDCVHIHQLRVRRVCRQGVVLCVHVGCVTVVVCVPGEVRRRD